MPCRPAGCRLGWAGLGWCAAPRHEPFPERERAVAYYYCNLGPVRQLGVCGEQTRPDQTRPDRLD